jgi:hypothetical protein
MGASKSRVENEIRADTTKGKLKLSGDSNPRRRLCCGECGFPRWRRLVDFIGNLTAQIATYFPK